MKHLGTTSPFLGPAGEPLPGSIAEVSYLRLGGIDQWVMMRGERVDNPPLVLLHGGPGMPEQFLSDLDELVTVAQRRFGKDKVVILGHLDPPNVVRGFDALSAPSKELVWFEQSGHEMFVDEPARFNAVLAQSVRPALA